MKSGKQRRAELDVKKQARAAKTAAEAREKARVEAQAEAARLAAAGIDVNRAAITLRSSYGEPDFVTRGYYVDLPFTCTDCGKPEIWTATQQKWWFEVAKGYPFSAAKRCGACRRRERERRDEARRVQQEGAARKRATNA